MHNLQFFISYKSLPFIFVVTYLVITRTIYWFFIFSVRVQEPNNSQVRTVASPALRYPTHFTWEMISRSDDRNLFRCASERDNNGFMGIFVYFVREHLFYARQNIFQAFPDLTGESFENFWWKTLLQRSPYLSTRRVEFFFFSFSGEGWPSRRSSQVKWKR